MLNDIDVNIVYHKWKANMIVDAYIHRYMGNFSYGGSQKGNGKRYPLIRKLSVDFGC